MTHDYPTDIEVAVAALQARNSALQDASITGHAYGDDGAEQADIKTAAQR